MVEDKDSEVREIQEGMIKKGGLNRKPTVPRPPEPPKPLQPKQQEKKKD